jgi:hypothetical protein
VVYHGLARNKIDLILLVNQISGAQFANLTLSAIFPLNKSPLLRFADLEGKLKEDLMMARIRDAENTQCVAELTQKISNLEYKNQELVAEGDLTTSISESDRMRELQDKVACLRAQVGEIWRTKEDKTQRRQSKNF